MVYFLEAEILTGTFIKIGYSTQIRQRLSQLQDTLAPVDFKLIGFITGDRETESALHLKFAPLRGRGEWFRDAPELRELAQPQLTGGVPKSVCLSAKNCLVEFVWKNFIYCVFKT